MYPGFCKIGSTGIHGSRLSCLTALGRDDTRSGGASHMPYQRREIMSRVLLRLSIATLIFAACMLPAQAQDWPTRPIRILVGFGAGGGTDIAARILAQPLSEILGQPVVVENRVGAGGTTAANAVATAPPDGYTALMMSNAHVIAPVIYKSIPYDSVKDFAMLSMVGTAGLIIVVHPDFPAKTLRELIAVLKASPGKYNFASPGV